MIRALHSGYAALAGILLWRAAQPLFATSPQLSAFPAAVLVASGAGSLLAIAAGATVWSPRRALVADLVTFAASAWWIFVISLGPWSRDLAGISVVLVTAARLAPGVLAVATARAPAWIGFAAALAAYVPLALWLPTASLPFGDQVHYLLGADRLRSGSLDASIDQGLFRSLIGVDPSEADRATHVADTPLGPRPVQGYAMSVLLLPGWAVAGALGAHLIVALVAAWVSLQTLLILRDTVGGQRGAAGSDPLAAVAAGSPTDESVRPAIVGWTWLLASFLPPLPLLATHLYPNAVGAALIATAFREGFTAPVRRPALAGALLAATLFLTPRDGLALLVLLPFLLRPAQQRWGVAVATAAVAALAVAANGLAYGLPAPYAGYAFGTAQAQGLTHEPSITPTFWVALPAILFDRTFGLAGSAPWVFVGLLGLVPALRADRARLLPAALAVGASALALSFYRYWEGGYAPPGRYFVEVLPLWAPFVAYGLAVALGATSRAGAPRVAAEAAGTGEALPLLRWSRTRLAAVAITTVVAIAVASSALASLLLNAIPTLALNTAFDHQLREAFARVLGLDPLGWLPSFQPVRADWYVAAYLLLTPAVAIAAGLIAYGRHVSPQEFIAGPQEIFARLSGQLGGPLGAEHPLAADHPTPRRSTPGDALGGVPRETTSAHRDLPLVDSPAGMDRSGPSIDRSGPSAADARRRVMADQPRVEERPRDPQRIGAVPRGSPAGPQQIGAPPHGSAARTRDRSQAVPGRLGPLGIWKDQAANETPLFLVLNLIAIAMVVVAGLQPWIGDGADPVPQSLISKWLPLSLALATAGTVLVARAVGPSVRSSLLVRHFSLYLVPLALMLLLHASGGRVLNGQLGAIYMLVAVGFAANALAALWTAVDRLPDRSAALRLAGVALVVFLVVWPYHRAVMTTASDEPHYLLIVQSLLYDGDLDLRNDYEGDRYSAFYQARLPDMHGIEVGNAVYPIRDLGLPILSLAPFAVAGRLGVLALLCVAGAALAAQLYLLLRDLRFAPRIALLAVATTALAHPILTYTTQIYPDLLIALAFVSAVRLLRAGAAAGPIELAAASALIGLLPWLSTRAWPIAAGLGLVVAYAALRPAFDGRRSLGRGLVPAAAGALPFLSLVLALAYVNWRMFDLFLPGAGYFIIREQQQVISYTPWIGAAGLLFDRVFGLIPRAPVYLLAFVGIAALIRRARAGRGTELAAITAGALLSFAYISAIAYWWADGSPPSRYLLGSLPLFVAGVAGGWEAVLAARRWPIRVMAWAIAVASVAVAYVYAVLPNIRYDLALDVRATGSSGGLFTFFGRALGADPGRAFPSLVQPDVTSVALAIAWLAIAAALAWVGGGIAFRGRRPAARRSEG